MDPVVEQLFQSFQVEMLPAVPVVSLNTEYLQDWALRLAGTWDLFLCLMPSGYAEWAIPFPFVPDPFSLCCISNYVT